MQDHKPLENKNHYLKGLDLTSEEVYKLRNKFLMIELNNNLIMG